MKPSAEFSPPAKPTGHRCLMCGRVIRSHQAAVWLVTAAVHERCGFYQSRARQADGAVQAEAAA